MAVYVALLRGINVGGRTIVGMADLRRVFADLGLDDAQTYLQSGNVVFRAPDELPAELAGHIEAHIARELGVTTTVLLRTGDELARIVATNPFIGQEADFAKLHVTFLAVVPDESRVATFQVPAGQPDELALIGREVYLHCPNGYGRTKLNNTFIEKRLGVVGTTRNWNTVTRLRDMTEG